MMMRYQRAKETGMRGQQPMSWGHAFAFVLLCGLTPSAWGQGLEAVLSRYTVDPSARSPAVITVAPDAEGTGVNHYVTTNATGVAQGPPPTRLNVNTFLGADRFYSNGLTGSNAIIANVEAGYIWQGHET